MQRAELGQMIKLHLEQRAHLLSAIISDHQRSSAIISEHQRASASISEHQRASVSIKQLDLQAIKINQRTVQCAGPRTATTAGSSAGS